MFRNPHLPPPEPAAPEPSQDAPRLRFLANDPQREYSQRLGDVERLPDSIAALLLCKTGADQVIRHKITVQLDGEKLHFSSAHSLIIAEKNGTGEKVTWALNRHNLDVLHLFDADGAYVESLPRKGEAEWFASDDESRRAYAEMKAHTARDGERLRHLHRPDTEAAQASARHNAAEVARIVSTFPQEAITQADAEIGQATVLARNLSRQEKARAERRTAERKTAGRKQAAAKAARTVGAETLGDLLPARERAATPPAHTDRREAEAALNDLLS